MIGYGYGYGMGMGMRRASGRLFDFANFLSDYEAAGSIFDSFDPASRIAGIPVIYTAGNAVADAADASTDTVGVLISRDQAAALVEKIVNPNLDTDTDWTKGTGITISGGAAHFASVASSQALSQAASGMGAAGSVMLFDYVIANFSAGGVIPRLGGAAIGAAIAGNVTGQQILIGTGATSTLEIRASGTTTLDILSWRGRQIAGNHAGQTTGANRPTVVDDGDRWVLRGDGSNDRLESYLKAAAAFSMVMVVKASAADCVFWGVKSASNGNFWIGLDASGFLTLCYGDDASLVADSVDLVDGEFHVVAFAVDGSGGKLWCDGALVGTLSPSGAPNTTLNPRIFGRNNNSTIDKFTTGDIAGLFAIQAKMSDSDVALASARLADAAAVPFEAEPAFAGTKWFIDGLDGDDGNDGRSAGAALKTWQAATAVDGAGDVIAIRGGEEHFLKGPGNTSTLAARIVGHGGQAIIDGGQDISGETFTQIGATDAYEVEVEHEQPASGATGGDAHHYSVRDGGPLTGEHLVWFHDDDKAANEANVAATPGSFCVNLVGDTSGHPHGQDSAGPYRYVIHRSDGSDPTGAELYIAGGGPTVFKLASETAQEQITITFGSQKDQAGGTGTIPATLKNWESRYFGAHGYVGPILLAEDILAIGRVNYDPDSSSNARSGIGLGGAINLFSSAELSHHCRISGIHVEWAQHGLYGHASSNAYIGGDLTVTGLVARRLAGAAINHGPFSGACLFDGVDAEDVDQLAVVGSDTIRNFSLKTWETAAEINNGRINLIDAYTAGPSTFEDGTIECRVSGITDRHLFRRQAGTPTVIFRRVTDTNWNVAARRFFWPTSSTWPDAHLVLEDTTLGDIARNTSVTAYPLSITATGTTKFGWKGKTRAQVVAEFAAAGKTATIASTVTMIDSAGNVVDPPA